MILTILPIESYKIDSTDLTIIRYNDKFIHNIYILTDSGTFSSRQKNWCKNVKIVRLPDPNNYEFYEVEKTGNIIKFYKISDISATGATGNNAAKIDYNIDKQATMSFDDSENSIFNDTSVWPDNKPIILGTYDLSDRINRFI